MFALSMLASESPREAEDKGQHGTAVRQEPGNVAGDLAPGH